MPPKPWQPSRPITVLIGLLTIWPPVYLVLFFGFIFFTIGTNAKDSLHAFMILMVLHVGTMLLMFALTAVYIVHAFRTDRIAEDRRVLWVVILFFGNMFAFPVYWYLYLWRREISESAG